MIAMDAVYDLSVSPPTYDFVSFLLAAETERRRRGAANLWMHVLAGPVNGFRRDRLPPFSAAERVAMRDKIVLPMAQLLPRCAGLTLHADRPPALRRAFGYGRPHYGFPVLFAAARAGLYPLRAPGASSVGDYVTLTLREAAYWPTRNSDPAAWLKVARWLRAGGRRVIVLRDTAKASEPFGDFEIAPAAASDLHARAALYAGAALNLFCNNGPAWLCLFMAAPCLVVKMTASDAPCCDDAFFTAHGFPRGAAWPNLRPRQAVEWISDDAEGVIAAAARLLPPAREAERSVA